MKHWRLVSLVFFIALFLGGCGEKSQSTLLPQGEVAKMQYDLLMLSTWIMVGVVAVVTIIFLYVVVKFRRKKGQEDVIPEQVEGNHKLEIIWTVIPIILLIILAVPTVRDTFTLADTRPIDGEEIPEDTVVVSAVAKLYWWEFEYQTPDGKNVVTAQDLVIPTGERVYIKLKGGDIKHSFWVPSLAGKMDTNTDNENKMYLQADNVGTYRGFCAEFCGPSHALMQFQVKAVEPAEFDQWFEKMKTTKSVATTDLAKQGEEIFNKSCIGCHAVDANGPATGVAPNLSNFGDRDKVAGILDNTHDNVEKWLKDPDSIKPGNKMSGTYGDLSDHEINALAEYLKGLKLE
ncbi:cytochrome c oxidase subunit II [Priestia taiwanensis]|uniref:Cytochrome c oxidase subunit 2 n=1 Tax=Priestia taiwanensis TaxID=1347902 RepID=A0A917APW2_9BACI|nr:cytochrome c oxidase subunit II [Priestia taiwanensis]MBM7362972.1 cytochrome c oxidase subunit 2 [Priestia taiwanensis]GGE66596.1 cytochrome c oxidase subunit 2 [Priestia taiwanensis]